MKRTKMHNACKTGYVFAVYRTHVEFGVWNGDYPWQKHNEDELLELHIFDKDSEYRAQRSAIAENGWIETVLQGDLTEHLIDSRMLLYGEELAASDELSYTVMENGRAQTFYLPEITEEKFRKGIYLLVRNYYAYDENDLLYLAGYRILGIEMGGEKHEG